MEYHVTQYFKVVNLSQRVVFKLQVDNLWKYVTRDSKKKIQFKSREKWSNICTYLYTGLYLCTEQSTSIILG